MKTLLAALAAATLPLALAAPAAAQAPEAEAAVTPERFSVEVIGEGPDVILIPGLSTPREVWRPTAEALKDRYRLHLVQVRGFGEPAGVNAEGPVLEPFVDELAEYIAEQDLHDPAIIGHSAGGLAALLLGIDHPDAPGRLMIVDSLPFFGVLAAGQPREDMTVEMVEPTARLIRDQLAATYGQPANPQANEASVAGHSLNPENHAKLAKWVASADPRVSAQLVYDDLTTDLRETIADIRVPVTLVYPWNDTYPREEQADAFYRSQYAALPTTEFVGIGNSAHFIMLDRPDALLQAIEAFLAE